jgi:hypothetical protein
MPAIDADSADEPDVAPVGPSAWRRGVRVGLTLYALAILIAGVAAGLDFGSIIATLFFVGLGAAIVATGLGLTAEDKAHSPRLGEDDFIWGWMVHLMPLRMARAWTVLLGCVFLAGAWYVWSVNRPSVSPEAGRYVTSDSELEPGFRVSFIVEGGQVRDDVLAWRASCTSGTVIAASVRSVARPDGDWSGGSDYVLDTANGDTEHVHPISDTGHFADSHTADGLLSLSVTVERDGRAIDRCKTGAVRWVAHRQGTAHTRG